jgi:hypothetical protein
MPAEEPVASVAVAVSPTTNLQKLVEVSCLRCKETVKELVSANPFNVLSLSLFAVPFFLVVIVHFW